MFMDRPVCGYVYTYRVTTMDESLQPSAAERNMFIDSGTV
jgi:hypothetical protein